MTAAKMSRSAILLALLILTTSLFTACGEDPVIGPVNDSASIALMRYEAQGDGIEGVVYHQINNFNAFIGGAKSPVLVVFYASSSVDNTMIIPRLEQMADDYRGQLEIVWIDAEAQTDLSELFNVETLPHFTIVIEATPKRSLIGYGAEGAADLDDLIKPYVSLNN